MPKSAALKKKTTSSTNPTKSKTLSRAKSPARGSRQSPAAVDVDSERDKDFLTEAEMKSFLDAARKGRYGVRDYAMMLVCYRHGLRVSELIGIRIKDLDLKTSRIFVRRKKGSLSTHQPIEGDELRAIRAWMRERDERSDSDSQYLFLSERGPFTRQAINYLVEKIGERAGLPFSINPHMLRHSTGFYLANKGYDTRLIQDYLGHKNISHTVRYTRTAAGRFENLW